MTPGVQAAMELVTQTLLWGYASGTAFCLIISLARRPQGR